MDVLIVAGIYLGDDIKIDIEPAGNYRQILFCDERGFPFVKLCIMSDEKAKELVDIIMKWWPDAFQGEENR